LDNPETTPPQTTPETAAPPATATTNGPNGNGGGGTATATATAPRREAPPPQPSRKYYTITELNAAKPKELVDIGKEFNVEGAATLPRQDLITRVLQAQTEAQGNIFAQGILEIVEDGFGFLRRSNLLPSPQDVYVSSSQVRRIGLRTGDFVTGQTRPPKDSEKYFSLLRVEAVNGIDPTVKALIRGQVRTLLADGHDDDPRIDDAVEEALRQRAQVDVLYDDAARRAVAGLAALLRFRR